MALGLREIRQKMKAVRSTRQVTKAMELVSASKMRRAVSQALSLRSYATLSLDILERISGRVDESSLAKHPALRPRPVENILAIIFTSDRGLCGGMHTQLFRATNEYLKQLRNVPSFRKIDFIAVGRKGQQYLARTNQNVVAAFPALSNRPTFRDALPIKRFASEKFLDGTYDHVVLLYPDFVSALVQEPTIRVLLPFSPSSLKEMIASLLQSNKRTEPKKETVESEEYLFEPNATDVLNAILPQLTEVQIFQAVLEAVASEHSARMVAMRSATDSATEFLEDLSLTYNQTRQAGITAELAELSASKAALE